MRLARRRSRRRRRCRSARRPSIRTVQAPQTPCSQPRCVPVRQQLLAQEIGEMRARFDFGRDRATFTMRNRPHASGLRRARDREPRAAAAPMRPREPPALRRDRSASAATAVELVGRAGHRAADGDAGACRSSSTAAMAWANSPGLRHDLDVAQARRGRRASGRAPRVSISPSASAVAKGRARISAAWARARVPERFSAVGAERGQRRDQSAAGSAWQRLPPIVPRFRTAR